jgi:hypothetical protein
MEKDITPKRNLSNTTRHDIDTLEIIIQYLLVKGVATLPENNTELRQSLQDAIQHIKDDFELNNP